MKPNPEEQRLLNDVLSEGGDSFRDALFRDTLRLARRRRRMRQARNYGVVLAILVAGLTLLRWERAPRQPPTVAVQKASYTIIVSQPLPASALVRTTPLAPEQIIVSSGNIQVIATAGTAQPAREIDDRQLLSLLGSTPAAIVRRGQGSAELVFINEADGEKFLRN